MVLCLLAFFLCLAFPSITSAGMKSGLSMICTQVIPALYPFILLTTLLKYLANRNAGNKYLSILISFLSGYPLGARIAASFSTSSGFFSSQSLLLICNNPSPAYMISFIGLHCFHSPSIGFQMYFAIITGNIITALIVTGIENIFYSKKTFLSKSRPDIPRKKEASLDIVIHETFSTLVRISGYILIFSVAAAFIQHLTFLTETARSLLSGLLEMTTGIQMLTARSISLTRKLLLVTGITSFGGLSVIAQTNSMISGSQLSIKKYMAEKGIASAIAISVMYILLQ